MSKLYLSFVTYRPTNLFFYYCCVLMLTVNLSSLKKNFLALYNLFNVIIIIIIIIIIKLLIIERLEIIDYRKACHGGGCVF